MRTERPAPYLFREAGARHPEPPCVFGTGSFSELSEVGPLPALQTSRRVLWVLPLCPLDRGPRNASFLLQGPTSQPGSQQSRAAERLFISNGGPGATGPRAGYCLLPASLFPEPEVHTHQAMNRSSLELAEAR